MFRRRPAIVDAARSALRDTTFPTSAPGLTSVEVDYDASVWTRVPHDEDRQEWLTQHRAALRADLGAEGEDYVATATAGLEQVVDHQLKHTADLVAFPQPARKVPTMVLYVDVLGDEQGRREHGEPDDYLAFAELEPTTTPKSEWFPNKRDGAAYRYATLHDPRPEPGMPSGMVRAHRLVQPGVHLYSMCFYPPGRGIEHILRVIHHVRAQGQGSA